MPDALLVSTPPLINATTATTSKTKNTQHKPFQRDEARTVLPRRRHCLVAATATAAFSCVSAGVPYISENWLGRSVEVDDTENVAVLRQSFFSSLTHHRLKMTASGSLTGGYLEQVTRCDYPWSGANGARGIFTQVADTSLTPTSNAACQTINMTDFEWTPFWDFPANATYMGKAVPPKTNLPAAHLWAFWEDNELAHFYAAVNTSAPVDRSVTPLWLGKVTVNNPDHHTWHIEYFGFEAVEPAASDFTPTIPPGVKCVPQASSSSSSSVLSTKKTQQRRQRRRMTGKHGLPLFF